MDSILSWQTISELGALPGIWMMCPVSLQWTKKKKPDFPLLSQQVSIVDNVFTRGRISCLLSLLCLGIFLWLDRREILYALTQTLLSIYAIRVHKYISIWTFIKVNLSPNSSTIDYSKLFMNLTYMESYVCPVLFLSVIILGNSILLCLTGIHQTL